MELCVLVCLCICVCFALCVVYLRDMNIKVSRQFSFFSVSSYVPRCTFLFSTCRQFANDERHGTGVLFVPFFSALFMDRRTLNDTSNVFFCLIPLSHNRPHWRWAPGILLRFFARKCWVLRAHLPPRSSPSFFHSLLLLHPYMWASGHLSFMVTFR